MATSKESHHWTVTVSDAFRCHIPILSEVAGIGPNSHVLRCTYLDWTVTRAPWLAGLTLLQVLLVIRSPHVQTLSTVFPSQLVSAKRYSTRPYSLHCAWEILKSTAKMTDMPQILQSCEKFLVKPNKTASWSFIQVRNWNFCGIWTCLTLSSERNLVSYP